MKKALIYIILALFLISCGEAQEAAEQAYNDATADTSTDIAPVEEPEPTEPETIQEEEIVIVEVIPESIPETVPELPETIVELIPEPVEIPELIPESVTFEVEIFVGDEPVIDATIDIIVVVETEPIPEPDPITLTLLTADALYFYNGEFVEQENINPKNCGYRCFTDGDQRLIYDQSGDIETAETLFIVPDFVVDDWIIESIDPDTAFELGALRTDYSRIYLQEVEQGFWFSNQWKAADLIKTISGDVIAVDELGGLHPLTDVSDINHAKNLLIRDYDDVNRTAVIENKSAFSVSWSTNYFNQAKDWVELDGVWYSWNGYELETDLTENANALWSWNTGDYIVDIPENPTVLMVGALDDSIYMIECNSGWLIRFTPKNDVLEAVNRLYMGDGLRLSGIDSRDTLKPVFIGSELIFWESGSFWKLDLESGFVELFFGEEGRVEKW